MKTCFLDLDGVITDFVGAAFALHKKSLPMKDVRWDFMEQIGISQEDFWEPMGYSFWLHLKFTSEAPALISCLEQVFGDKIVLLTSPCATSGCIEGKIDWIKRNLPKYARRYLAGASKHLLAGPEKLLIDDYDANINSFQTFGGGTITVPRPWNSSRIQCNEDGYGFSVARLMNEVDEWMKA